ncbi:hypothetical protein L2E82_10885 [Cichorium intybus]|uniref:Uncharacterized protein n=1 Tax=Cichorium intybus TaxID=13427 RepID=A0ACB9GBP1_CICIN|nr:hypothetical protein L2E82_10885 [Cichorium intybus]
MTDEINWRKENYRDPWNKRFGIIDCSGANDSVSSLFGDDHRIMIYYPSATGGGMKELFRKVGNRSSEFHPEVRRVRREGSYIYEEFMPTGGTDVKVYTVGPEYAHAEARKSPVVDGVVMRNPDGKEVRYPVLLTPNEKQMVREVCIGFRQGVLADKQILLIIIECDCSIQVLMEHSLVWLCILSLQHHFQFDNIYSWQDPLIFLDLKVQIPGMRRSSEVLNEESVGNDNLLENGLRYLLLEYFAVYF